LPYRRRGIKPLAAPCAAFLLSFLLCLSSCVRQGGGTSAREASGGLAELTDDEGNTVSFDRPFTRIISFYSAHTENLFALGAGASVIGINSAAGLPEAARGIPVFDYTGDPEYAIAASPDAVLIRPFVRRRNPAYIAALEKAGIPVVSLYPETFDDFDGYIRRLALLAGADAEQKLQDFHAGLQTIRYTAAPIRNRLNVFFETTENGTRTASPQSLPAIAIEIAGGINVAQDAKPVNPLSSIAAYGTERLLSHAESVDVYIVQTGAMNPARSMEALLKRPGFSAIKALRDGRVLFIDEQTISSPVFRYLQGVKTIAHFLYPDEFDKAD
jgi:iron complex transport system substrate-binding protein